MPSFTEDFSALDEEGIRWDVRQAKAHGFTSNDMCVVETGLTTDEAKHLISIVCDEAAGDIDVSFTLLNDSFEQSVDRLQHAEVAGASHALLGYPQTFRPQDQQEYQATATWPRRRASGSSCTRATSSTSPASTRARCLSTPTTRSPTSPTSSGDKVGFMDPAMTFEALRRYGDRVRGQRRHTVADGAVPAPAPRVRRPVVRRRRLGVLAVGREAVRRRVLRPRHERQARRGDAALLPARARDRGSDAGEPRPRRRRRHVPLADGQVRRPGRSAATGA